MKKQKPAVRSKMVTLRMNSDEFSILEKNRKKTTARTNSNYLRKLSQQQPVTILYRNASIDSFAKEIIALRKEMNAIGVNFNQVVHKLHTLNKIPEFRLWANTYDQTRIALLQKSQNIYTQIQKIAEQWSQE